MVRVTVTERGIIRNIGRKQQINDFSGIRYENITPTDLDGVIDYKNRVFVFLEVKYLDADLPFGQRLALERIVDAMGKKRAIAIIAEHDVEDTGKSVPVASCDVREYYLSGIKKWKPPKEPIKVKKLVDTFIEFYA